MKKTRSASGGAVRRPFDRLDSDRLRAALPARLRGLPLQIVDEVDTTQRLAMELAAAGAPHLATALAERQTSGRGRHGRAWDSKASAGVWMSSSLRLRTPVRRVASFAIAAAVAVCEAIECAWGEGGRNRCEVKWPNDVRIDGRKCAGILMELAPKRVHQSAGGDPDGCTIIVGIGINANQEALDFPLPLRETATSLRMAAGAPFDRNELAAEVLRSLASAHASFEEAGLAPFIDKWERRYPALGRRVCAIAGSRAAEGTVLGLSDAGLLRVQQDDGSIEWIHSPDVQLRMHPALSQERRHERND